MLCTVSSVSTTLTGTTAMNLFVLIFFVSAALGDGNDGNQRIATSLQAALNEFCKSSPKYAGCFQRPKQSPITGPEGCPISTRKCPNENGACLPDNLPCDLLESQETCKIPDNVPDALFQVVFCGTGRDSESCVFQNRVPVLSMMAVQCRQQQLHTNAFYSVNTLKSHKVREPETGAGIYRCLPNDIWEPVQENTSPLQALLSSCYLANCGRTLTPQGDLAFYQHWPWIRHVLDEKERVVCTATLIYSDAVITAAHCVTELSSNKPVSLSSRFLTIPVGKVTQITRIWKIIVHPDYRGGGSYQNDIAILKFRNRHGSYLPKACLPLNIPAIVPSNGLIFKYEDFFRNWTMSKAVISNSCSSHQGRNCDTSISSQEFCAQQMRSAPDEISSGGPFLVNLIDSSLDYTWSVYGVYSRTHRSESSCNGNHIYLKTEGYENWLLWCVVYDLC